MLESINWEDRIGSLGKLSNHNSQHRVLERRVVHKAVILKKGKRSLWTTQLSTDQHMHMGELLKMGKDQPNKFRGTMFGAHKG